MSLKDDWLQRLAYSRDELLASLHGLGQVGWTTGEVLPGWTAKDVLAHIAAWETRVAAYLPDLLADRGERLAGVEADAFNAEQVALRRERTPGELLDELAGACQRIIQALQQAGDDDLSRPRQVPWGQLTIERWALQEICVHDHEHAVQLRAWRAARPESGRSLRETLLDDLAAQRADLLFACLGLDAHTLAHAPVMEGWTVKDILAHLADWDDVNTGRARLALGGHEADITRVSADERNAEIWPQRRSWAPAQALQAALEARQRWLGLFETASDAQLVRPLHLAWGETSVWEFAWRRARHDATHAAHIRAWREAASASLFSPGPRDWLLAAQSAAQDDWLRQVEGVPAAERGSRRVMGEWTLLDLLGHAAKWDRFALQGLQALRANQPLPETPDSDAGALNAQSWEQAWADSQNAYAELMRELNEWDEAQLARTVNYAHDWGCTAYGWIVVQIWHDREHADALRASIHTPA